MISKVKSQYDLIAEDWDKFSGENGSIHQKNDIDPVVFKMLGDVKGKTLLEIGCGNGYLGRLLSQKGAIVTSTDISSKLIKLAQKKSLSVKQRIVFLTQDAQKMTDLKDHSFDFVLANMCVMDIPNIEAVFSEVKRVLKMRVYSFFHLTIPLFIILVNPGYIIGVAAGSILLE